MGAGDAFSNPRWYPLSSGHFYQGPCQTGRWQWQKTQSSLSLAFPSILIPLFSPQPGAAGVLEQLPPRPDRDTDEDRH